MLVGKLASAQFGLFGGVPDCGLIGASCPFIGAHDCCGDQLTECVDDGAGIGSGVVKLKNCKKGKVCIPDPNGGGACGNPTKA